MQGEGLGDLVAKAGGGQSLRTVDPAPQGLEVTGGQRGGNGRHHGLHFFPELLEAGEQVVGREIGKPLCGDSLQTRMAPLCQGFGHGGRARGARQGPHRVRHAVVLRAGIAGLGGFHAADSDH